MNTTAPDEKIVFWNHIAPMYDLIMDYGTRNYHCLTRMIAEDNRDFRRVLDAASGTGQTAVQLSYYCDMVDAIDISPKMIDCAWKKAIRQRIQNLAFAIQNIYRLEYESGLFNGVVCCNTFFCLKEPIAALNEIRRVLKPGGLLTAPTFCHNQDIGTRLRKLLIKLSGVKIYQPFSAGKLIQMIRDGGFKIVKNEILEDIIPIAYITAVKSE